MIVNKNSSAISGFTRKQVCFDIDTIKARELIGPNYNYIYKKMGNFLKDNSFIHVQGSVYESKNSLTNSKLISIMKDMLTKFPQLNNCIRDIRCTDISNTHILNHLLEKNEKMPYQQKNSQKNQPEKLTIDHTHLL